VRVATHPFPNDPERRLTLQQAHKPAMTGGAASKTLWICRCAWTTLLRRSQLHRGQYHKHGLMKQKKELWLGRMNSVTPVGWPPLSNDRSGA